MMQRRLESALRYAFLVATVSARALIILAPTAGLFAQKGTRPQRMASMRRVSPDSSTTYTSFVGATLKLGSSSVSPSDAPKYFAISSGCEEETKRPHMRWCLPERHDKTHEPTTGAPVAALTSKFTG